MLNSNDLISFVKTYFSHPFFLEQPDKQILHIVVSASQQLRAKKPNLPWLIGIKSYSAQELYTDGVQAQLNHWITRGCDLFYYVNYIESWQGAAPRNSEVKKRLWLPVDYDYRLPVTLKRLVLHLELRPTVVYRTSETEDGVKKYQGLWAFDDGDGGINTTRAKKFMREWCRTLGSDESVGNAARMLRLPGSKNWKDGVVPSRRDVKVLFEEVCPAGVLEGRDAESITGALTLYSTTRTAVAVRSAVPAPAHGGKTALSKREKDTPEELSGVDWRDALAVAKAEDSDVRVNPSLAKIRGTGHRHNLLTRWAGQVANEVGRGILTLQEAKEVLVDLGYSTFAEPLGQQEVEGVVGWMCETIRLNQEALAAELQEQLGMLPDAVEEPSGVDTGVVESSPKRAAGMLPRGGDLVDDWSLLSTRRIKWSGEICDYQPELDGSEEGYKTFLADFLCALNDIKRADGMTDGLVTLLISRAEKMLLLHGGIYHLPERGTNGMGQSIQWLAAVDGDRLADHFGVVMQALVERIKVGWKDLKQIPAIKKELLRIEADCRVECAARGIVDEVDLLKVVTARVKSFFDIKLSYSLRTRVCKELVVAISRLPDDGSAVQNKWVGGEDIVFQNGIYNVAAGEWAECWGWRLSQRALWLDLSVESVREYADILSVGGLHGFIDMVERDCPIWGGFMRDTFPDDKGSWVLWLLILGYSSVGTNRHQVIFSFIGLGGTGKSTAARIISGLLGRGACVNLDYERLAKEYEGIVHCVGKCLCICDEAELAGGKKAHNEVFRKLKEITGGERVSVRGIYGRAYEAEIGSKFIVISNEQLDYSDQSGAGKRRMISMKFEQVVTQSAVDDKLIERVVKGEGGALMAAAAALLNYRWKMGRRMWEIEGGSKAATAGVAELEEATNPIAWFMKNVLVKKKHNSGGAVGTKRRRGNSYALATAGVPLEILFEACRAYVESSGARGIKRRQLTDRQLLVQLQRVLKEIGEDPEAVIARVRLKHSSGEDQRVKIIQGWYILNKYAREHIDLDSVCTTISQNDYEVWESIKNIPTWQWLAE